jgi:transcription antitermination factor NusG
MVDQENLRYEHWYAARTRSNFEKTVRDSLDSQGFETYLPLFEEIHQWKDRRKRVMLPLFPGYVFVRFLDEPARRLKVQMARGMVRILGKDGTPEAIPDAQLDSVRRLLGANALCIRQTLLQTGAPIVVKRGPLKGLEGILTRVKTQARLVITLPLLQQSVATEIDLADVEPISRGRAPKPAEKLDTDATPRVRTMSTAYGVL